MRNPLFPFYTSQESRTPTSMLSNSQGFQSSTGMNQPVGIYSHLPDGITENAHAHACTLAGTHYEVSPTATSTAPQNLPEGSRWLVRRICSFQPGSQASPSEHAVHTLCQCARGAHVSCSTCQGARGHMCHAHACVQAGCGGAHMSYSNALA